jgi:P-type Ca2+ transporter type 2C
LHLYKSYGIVLAQTSAFVTWLLGHIFLALNLKQKKTPLIYQGFFSNYFAALWLLAMVAFSIIITSIPFLYPYFNTTYLPLKIWAEIILIIIVATFWIEIKKIIKFKLENR